ncbi:PAS domain-containing serine/threonine-protein kinase-like [Uloborus diversus]|uniref:PAS domain-containing serine/threonine-protein kinase-like n=1 Tax=Uloborus diversus TaxID=327109 RepID=UPI00240A90DC|nr:PAS domain-containing serine/threonine-protein kinase-like [Uloborus diversus]
MFGLPQDATLQWKSFDQNYNNKPCVTHYFSPLEVQATRRKRALQFGLTPPTDPFLHNQSFPNIYKHVENGNSYLDMGERRKCTIDKFKGNSLTSVSYSPTTLKSGACLSKSDLYHRRQLSGSWIFYHYLEGESKDSSVHACLQNPNKAIVTINARTTEILIANKIASHLLGIREKSTENYKLSDYILSREDQNSLTEADLKYSGELIFISGKVMDLISPAKETIPVSVWARQLSSENEPRCLVVMEPVERITGEFDIDLKGKITSCDKNFATVFGFLDPSDLKDLDVKDLIPSFELNHENYSTNKKNVKFCATGKTKDGFPFPLSMLITPIYPALNQDLYEGKNEMKKMTYKGTVWVFNNISGMITLLPDGTIHSCNTNFSLMLFGYSQAELQGKSICTLIPTFYEDVEFLDTDSMALPPFDEDEDSNAKCCCTSDGRTTADSIATDLPRPINPMGKHIEQMVDEAVENIKNFAFSPSPSENQMSSCCKKSPFLLNDSPVNEVSDLKSVQLNGKCIDCDSRNEELSESSSLCGTSSKHLSISESQDTLHSCANSITESDMNANILELSENEDVPINTSATNKLTSQQQKREEPVDFFSDSSEDEESYSSLAEDFPSNDKLDYACENEKVALKLHEADCSISCEKKEENTKPVSPPSNFKSNSLDFIMKTSTPRELAQSTSMPMNDDSYQSLPEGGFLGIGRHKDGTDLAIEYFIKKIILDDGKHLYCLWVSRDPEETKNFIPPVPLVKPLPSCSSSETTKSTSSSEDSDTSSVKSDSFYVTGTFTEKYTILQHIRKGAFGCVKKAFRNSDGLLVIAKFISKSEVYKDSWVYDNQQNRKVPLEVSLLTTIDHPNIVKVLDVFENENCFQMIMEKHGCGMDLFEFIERNPDMDEALASYIFRQVVSALSYLDSLFILHRDIKDENIILDEKFHVKLIDFGSATFMTEELFSTFCGTMEYCSPEVIQGEKYRGPELEMWALGVTLYTLIFGENPFIDVDETLKGEIKITQNISKELSSLIHHLLEPDPIKRCILSEVKQHPWVTQPVEIEKYKFSEVINASEEEIDPPKYMTNFEANILMENSNYADFDNSYMDTKSGSFQPCSSTESEVDSLS